MNRKVSVIIPTFNGKDKIGNILSSLENQTSQYFEVIVVIDGSTDDTLSILKRKKEKNYRLRYFYQENRGRAATRNFGAKQAKGDLLVFFDDDIRPDSNCLLQHLNHHEKYFGSLAVGKPIEDKDLMKSDVQKYKRHLSYKWYQSLKSTFLQEQEKLFFTAANFSIGVKEFWELAGFKESLRDAEDYDLGRRALASGKMVYFLNNAIGYHDDFISAKSYIIRLRQYREAHQILSHLYPEIRGRAKKEGIVKHCIYRLFAFPFLVEFIDDEFFIFLPKKVRYKIYDLIFTSLSQNYYNVPLQ